jgi:TetR/AcrR family transcriptional regulator, transcriptional repressor of aconitase
MPKVSAAHRESRRDQITDAAVRSFAAKGFQRASMADIIAESGLSAGAIYGHFESKQQIAIAVAERIVGNRLQEFGERLARDPLPDPDEVLELLMAGLVRDLHDTRLLVQLWGEAIFDPAVSAIVGRILGDVRRTIQPYLARWAMQRRGLDGPAADDWAEAVLPVMLGLTQGFVVQSALLPNFDSAAYLAGVHTLFLA